MDRPCADDGKGAAHLRMHTTPHARNPIGQGEEYSADRPSGAGRGADTGAPAAGTQPPLAGVWSSCCGYATPSGGQISSWRPCGGRKVEIRRGAHVARLKCDMAPMWRPQG
eukprot:1191293-Prorocentrum_minimum.AAC.1